jgi:hypothetical protein
MNLEEAKNKVRQAIKVNTISDLVVKGSPVAVMILSNEFLRSRVLFTIIYKVYILIYNPAPSS